MVPAGLGTALKPSHEPIILARKPLPGTVAANVLAHGTGALNVDGCRVGIDKRVPGSPKVAAASLHTVSLPGFDGGSGHDPNVGRWPPNVLLTHSAACVPIGTREVKAHPSWDTPNRDTQPSAFTGESVSQVRHTEDVVVEYDCAPDCPVRELDAQSGSSASTCGPNPGGKRGPGFGHSGIVRGVAAFGDEGTASRFYPQSQWDPQLDDVARFTPERKTCASARSVICNSNRSVGSNNSAGTDALDSQKQERSDSEPASRSSADTAAAPSLTTRATDESSAPLNALSAPIEASVLAVYVAGNGSSSCGTDTAPNRAVSDLNCEEPRHAPSCPATGTRGTRKSRSKGRADAIEQTLNSNANARHDRADTGATQLQSHARNAVAPMCSGTTTTTAVPITSGSSVGPVTSSTTFESTEAGDLDCGARFRYCAKASRAERDAGLEHFRARTAAELTSSEDGQARLASPRTGAGRTGGARNPHPTVKPVDLLRWLVRLVTPPRGVVLDPFAGSGSCGMAAIAEGFRYLGCELNDTDEEPFATIARARITWMEGGNYVPRESLRAPNGPKQRSLFDSAGES